MKHEKNKIEYPFHPISHDNNMAFIRYVLSFFVVIAHTSTLAYINLPFSNYSFEAVGGFFAFSGFLLFATFQKNPNLKEYLKKRACRILPPYILIILLCAFLLAGVSSLPLLEYYSNNKFWEYIAANLSFLNFIQPNLPGVFDSPIYYNSAVNGSLWTMKGEWICYISVPLLSWFIYKKPKDSSFIFIILISICFFIRYCLFLKAESTGKDIYYTIEKQFGTIFLFFYIGGFLNIIYPKFLKYKWYIIIVSILVIAFRSYYETIFNLFLRPIVISTIVIWFSQVGRWGWFMRNKHDLSYDIYLFHYPIIQLSIHYNLVNILSPLKFLLFICVITTLLSFISWNLVGKRFIIKRR